MKRTIYVTLTVLIDGAYITYRRAMFAAVETGLRIVGFETRRETVRYHREAYL
jgi:hypothetical protein